jgi:hypothetical protein
MLAGNKLKMLRCKVLQLQVKLSFVEKFMGFEKPYICPKAMQCWCIYWQIKKKKGSILALRKQLFGSSAEEDR